MINTQSFLEFPFSFDLEKLISDLSCVKNTEWVSHPNTNAYEGSWLVSSLTATNGDTKNIVAVENQEYFDTPLMKRTKYIKEVLKVFNTKIEAVRFMKLEANSKIKEHCDRGSSFEKGYARIHIPITSNEKVKFILSKNIYKMELGKCYYIDANNPHSVVNEGDTSRVHLLIDCHINPWFEKFFLEAGFKKPYNKYGNKNITDDNIEDVLFSLKSLGTNAALELAKNLESKRLSYYE